MEEQMAPPSGGGSIPTPPLQSLTKTPVCRLLTAEESNVMLNNWHYLGEVRGILFSVGHNEGCCVFTNCRSRIYEKKHPGVVELSRMVGMPNHTWAMSSLMAQAVRECRKREYTSIITYADPWNNNTGKVYLAAGWTAAGATGKDTVYMLDGERIARRTLYDRHGTQSQTKMKEIYGERLQFQVAPPKPIFVKIISKGRK